MAKIPVKIAKSRPHRTKAKKPLPAPQDSAAQQLAVPAEMLLDSVIAHGLALGVQAIHFEWQPFAVRLRYRLHNRLVSPLELNGDQVAVLRRQIRDRFAYSHRPSVPYQEQTIEYHHDERIYFITLSSLVTSVGERQVLAIGQAPEASLDRFRLTQAEMKAFDVLVKGAGLLPVLIRPTADRLAFLAGLAARSGRRAEQTVFIGDFLSYPASGFAYMPVKPEIGFSRSVALRASLRSQFDVVVIDHLASAVELEFALAIASAGKLVLVGVVADQLHAGFNYLWHLAEDRAMLVKQLSGLALAKPLPQLCPRCRQEKPLSKLSARAIDAVLAQHKHCKIRTAKSYFDSAGCPACSNGGRIGHAWLTAAYALDKRLKKKICNGAEAFRFGDLLAGKSGLPLRIAGLHKASAGLISLQDALDLENYNQ